MNLKTVISNLKDSKTVTEFVKVIATWFFDFGWITAGKNINIQKSSNGIVISGRDTPPSGSGDNNPVFTPFALSFVAGGNVVTVGKDRAVYHGLIIRGRKKMFMRIPETILVNSSVYIYYDFSPNYSPGLMSNITLPIATQYTYQIMLGKVIWDTINNEITDVISYYPYGNLTFVSRIFL